MLSKWRHQRKLKSSARSKIQWVNHQHFVFCSVLEDVGVKLFPLSHLIFDERWVVSEGRSPAPVGVGVPDGQQARAAVRDSPFHQTDNVHDLGWIGVVGCISKENESQALTRHLGNNHSYHFSVQLKWVTNMPKRLRTRFWFLTSMSTSFLSANVSFHFEVYIYIGGEVLGQTDRGA